MSSPDDRLEDSSSTSAATSTATAAVSSAEMAHFSMTMNEQQQLEEEAEGEAKRAEPEENTAMAVVAEPRQSRWTATHFLSIRIRSKGILTALQDMQERIIGQQQQIAEDRIRLLAERGRQFQHHPPPANRYESLLRQCLVTTQHAHVTLQVLHLPTPESIEGAVHRLENVIRPHFHADVLGGSMLSVRGLGSFQESVIYACCEFPSSFSRFWQIVRSTFPEEQHAYFHRFERPQVPQQPLQEQQSGTQLQSESEASGRRAHVTLFKVSKLKNGLRQGENPQHWHRNFRLLKALWQRFAKTDFGSETIVSVDLCSMSKASSSGDHDPYFRVVSSIDLLQPSPAGGVSAFGGDPQ